MNSGQSISDVNRSSKTYNNIINIFKEDNNE